jgi:hypothetical protein
MSVWCALQRSAKDARSSVGPIWQDRQRLNPGPIITILSRGSEAHENRKGNSASLVKSASRWRPHTPIGLLSAPPHHCFCLQVSNPLPPRGMRRGARHGVKTAPSGARKLPMLDSRDDAALRRRRVAL